MADEPQEKKSLTSYFTKKVIVTLGAVATVLTIVGGIWAFEAHYATNHRVDGVVKVAAKDVEDLEIQVASALQNQQLKSDIKFYQFMDDKLREDQYMIRKELEKNPTDPMLQRDYDEIQERREKLQREIDSSMQKIKVN